MGNRFTWLVFDLFGQNAKVKITEGRFDFDVKAGRQGNDKVFVRNGDLEINNVGTSLYVTMNGMEQPGEYYEIFLVIGGSLTGDFANYFFTNAAFGTLITSWDYQLITQ